MTLTSFIFFTIYLLFIFLDFLFNLPRIVLKFTIKLVRLQIAINLCYIVRRVLIKWLPSVFKLKVANKILYIAMCIGGIDIMLRAVDPNTIEKWVPKECRSLPKEEQTSFDLRPLRVREAAEIRDTVYMGEGFGDKRRERLMTGTQERLTLIKVLRGWTNFLGPNNEPVTFDESNNENNLDRIPERIRSEMYSYSTGQTEVDENLENS